MTIPHKSDPAIGPQLSAMGPRCCIIEWVGGLAAGCGQRCHPPAFLPRDMRSMSGTESWKSLRDFSGRKQKGGWGSTERGSSFIEYLVVTAAIIAAVVALIGPVQANWTTLMTNAVNRITTVGTLP